MFLAFALLTAVIMPSCKSTSALEKALERESKEKMTEFKKEGWKVCGTSHSLEVALLTHYEGLKKEGAKEVVGVASAFVSENIGKQAAFNSAINEYARKAQSFVRGRVISDMFNNADDVPEEFDKFYAAYESMVAKEIKGELEPSFSVIRSKGKNQKGQEVFEMRTYCIVNEAEASKARLRAMENALKESTLAEKYASKVADFIREGFELEESGKE